MPAFTVLTLVGRVLDRLPYLTRQLSLRITPEQACCTSLTEGLHPPETMIDGF